jgi:hypothetical protein
MKDHYKLQGTKPFNESLAKLNKHHKNLCFSCVLEILEHRYEHLLPRNQRVGRTVKTQNLGNNIASALSLA